MVNVSIARRYARALIEAAGPASDQVLFQLEAFVAALTQSPELEDVVENPAYPREQKAAVIDAVMAKVGAHEPMLINLIKLLGDRHRLVYLPDIARLFRDQADLKAGRVRGKVVSAVPLSSEALGRLERSLEALTQRNVVLETQVDPSILGGASTQVGSVIYDGTLRTQLDQLRRELLAR